MKYILYLDNNKEPVSLAELLNPKTLKDGDTVTLHFPSGRTKEIEVVKCGDTANALPDDVSGVTKDIYVFIVNYIGEHNYPPTVQEIMQGIYLYSTSTVHYHLGKLQSLGLIEVNRSSRAIKVVGYKFVREVL